MTDASVWNPTDPIHKTHEKALQSFYTADSNLRVHEPRELADLTASASDSGDFSGFDFCQPHVPSLKSILVSKTKVKFADPIAEVMIFNQRMPANTPLMSLRQVALIGLVNTWSDLETIDLHDVDSFAVPLMFDTGFTEDMRSLRSCISKRKGFVTPEKLAKNWNIGLEAAKRTVEATTQMAVRDFTTTTGGRRLKPYSWILKQKRLSTDVYTDTLFGKCKSLRGNTCCQIYATSFHFVMARPMVSKSLQVLTKPVKSTRRRDIKGVFAGIL